MWIANSLASYFQFCHNEVLPRLRSGGHPLQLYQSEVSNEWSAFSLLQTYINY